MSTTVNKFKLTNSDKLKRYEELVSLENEACQFSLKTRQKFENLITTYSGYIFAVLVLIIVYLVAYWDQWSTTSIIIVAVMALFEIVAGIFLYRKINQAKKRQKELAGKESTLVVEKSHIDISTKAPATNLTLKREDIRSIYITRYNVVFMPQSGVEASAIIVDKSDFGVAQATLKDFGYGDLIFEVK